MIACKHMDPLVGIDTHITLIPSPAGPIPTPLPNPYVGMVFDPMDYVPFLGATVKINGLPRGIAGGSGQALPPHLPLAGPFAKPPSNESEIFMGSATVVADGSPQSFLALPVLSCQDIGMPAPPRPNKRSEAKSLMLPTTVVLCVPMGPPVLIGGPPTISMMAMAMKGIMAGLKKLRGIMKASEKMAALSAKLRAMAAKLCKALGLGPNALAAMEKAICTVTGHPVDVANGRVFTEQTDFAMAGPLPLVWQRTWYSTSTYRGPLGHGWHHAYDVCLHVTDEVLLLRAADGRHLALPPLADGESFFDRKEKLTLRRIGNTYSVRRAGLTHVFSGDGQDRRPVRVEDDLGNRIALLHDSAGRLTSVVDSGGRSFELQYGRDGLLMQVEGPDPDHPLRKVVLVRYDYDPHGNLIYAHDALGQTTRYEYSGHLLAREVNRNGLAFYFEYDGKDEKDKKDEKPRCVHTWGDAGIYDHKLTYRSGVTVVESSLGQKTTYHHRGGLVWKTVDALGGITLTERNEWNEIVSETDALGQVKESVRDGRGNLVLEKSPDGSAVTLTYDASDRPVSLRGAAGGEWRWSYDQAGRMVERTDALGQRTLFRWSGARLLGVTDPSGHETLLDYDSAGNLSVLRTPDGAETRWSYDGLGRCVRVQDPGGNIEARQFDILGRVVRVQEPDGSVRELSYDGEGNVARAKDQHYDVAFKYGGMNRLLTRTQAGATVRFAYDTEEQLIAIYNEAGLVYRFALGPTGEVSEEYGFDGLHRKYERDKAGRVHRVLRPAGLATEYAYDGANRVLGLKHTDAQGNVLGEEKYVYGKDGELVAADNGTCAVKLDRDLLGRVVKEHQGGDTVESEYGPLGLRSRMKTSRGHVLEIERSVVGDVLALRAGGGPALAPASDAKSDDQVPTWETRFTRDQLGLEIERHLPGGVRSVWQRDKLGRALKHEIWSGKKLLGAKSYTWEPNNRLKMIVDALHGPARYGHDGMGNLAAVVYGDSKIDLRMPDAVGNLFRSNDRRDRTYGPAGQLLESLTKEGITRYSYDPEGNLTSKVLPDGSTWKYAWNAAGMLAKVIRPDGQEVTFGYDALGRRVWKKFKGKTTKWIWDGNVPVHEWVELDPGTLATPAPEMLAEADDAGLRQRAVNLSKRAAQGPPPAATEHGSADQPITWVFDPESFAPAAKLTSTQHYAIITDHLGTPSAMVDADGRASWSADLGIYGELRHVVGDKQACPFRWPGQYEDEETGLYYNRFRYYDPESGEYVSQDPIGLAGKNPGFHAYARDPNIFTDAFGLSCGSHSVYTLKDKAGNIVYVGITSRSPRERMLEHLRDGKAFHHMEVVAEGLGRTEARDIEGSALRHMSSEPLQNSRRLDGNFFHSYGDPPGGNRTLLSPGQTSSVLNNGLFSIFR